MFPYNSQNKLSIIIKAIVSCGVDRIRKGLSPTENIHAIAERIDCEIDSGYYEVRKLIEKSIKQIKTKKQFSDLEARIAKFHSTA